MNNDFYKAFEDRFRGSRDLVKSRLQAYLPFIDPLKEIYSGAPSIDLGCGRGEWLEILNTNGFLSLGVDLDESMLLSCRERQLNVQTAEAISFLKQLPDESQAVVSAFHLIEHIPFDDLQTLVIESLRVLKPAGLLILETPNPENIKVSTENFYLDPTHIKPIPSQLLSFLPEFHGFQQVKILRLQENKSLVTQESINIQNVLEGASPDYAVIAQKKASAEMLELFDEVFALDVGLSLTELSEKFEDRLLKIETKASQAEDKASQAEAKANQAKTKAEQSDVKAEQASNSAESFRNELNTVYNSRSWRITLPLRWVTRQFRLLKQQGISSRIKALVNKTIRPPIQRLITHIDSNARFRNFIVVATSKIGLYHLMRSVYRRLTGQPQKIAFRPNNGVSQKYCTVDDLTPYAKEIYNELIQAVNIEKNK